ncbi:hypothetical protein HELRODRAFT_167334 [Helobdella robusta]|uniref:Uncharacterized protein n=1 Tax=Helobdella robusta TaxID=6412 RepID=T1EZ98_HELRO|nr:hypothetical protein HELRODRAFT_167334 [Helobdella robusta]ESO10833.1 hypothetical protein HELRODRAFT_167334 [Helobdella robusta]
MGNTHDSEIARIEADHIENRWKTTEDYMWGYTGDRGEMVMKMRGMMWGEIVMKMRVMMWGEIVMKMRVMMWGEIVMKMRVMILDIDANLLNLHTALFHTSATQCYVTTLHCYILTYNSI